MQLDALQYPNKQTPNALHRHLNQLQLEKTNDKNFQKQSGMTPQQFTMDSRTEQHQTACHSIPFTAPKDITAQRFYTNSKLAVEYLIKKEGASDEDLIGPHKLQAQQLTPKSVLHFMCSTFHLLPAATEEHDPLLSTQTTQVISPTTCIGSIKHNRTVSFTHTPQNKSACGPLQLDTDRASAGLARPLPWLAGCCNNHVGS